MPHRGSELVPLREPLSRPEAAAMPPDVPCCPAACPATCRPPPRLASKEPRPYYPAMNAWLRTISRLTLCLVLLLTTLGGQAAQHRPCMSDGADHSMYGHAAALADDAKTDADKEHDCCDQEKSARLGIKVCKPGTMQCPAPVFVLQPPSELLSGGSPATPLFIYRFSLSSAPAATFWRPPRA